MKSIDIKRELEKIYREIDSWCLFKGPFTSGEIRRKELILIKQQILYDLDEAKRTNDLLKEIFNTQLYMLIDDYIKRFEH